jgi:hypothetical protein
LRPFSLQCQPLDDCEACTMNEAAIFGLVGTVIGATLSWLKDWLFERKRRTGHASYLAVRVICILDRFVSDCYDFVCNGRSDDGSLPKFAGFPDDIDWKAISPDLMYQILRFPNEILSANDSIQFITDVVAAPPDYEEIIEERQSIRIARAHRVEPSK